MMSGEIKEFVIPDRLRGKPNDTPQQRLTKRKKVKNLKRKYKMNLIERDNR